VRGQRNLPAPRQRFRDTVNPALSCAVRAARGWGVSPLTPYPSPLPGERGASALFATNKTQQSPLAPTGERGRGEGAEKPASPSLTLQGHRESSTLVRCPCGAWLGRFTPHPLPLSPSRGEGASALFTTNKTRQSPLAPTGGGAGVRGQRNLPAPRQPFRDTVNPAYSCTVRATRGWAFHPSPPTPLPFQGRGGQCSFATNKTQQSPLAPTGERGG
jgi:hypothetical protein